MLEEQRKYERKPSRAHLRVCTSVSNVAYTVSLQNVSLGGAFVRAEQFPQKGEVITFDVLDKYGLIVMKGNGTVVRVVALDRELGMGFAVEFTEELELAMMDFLIDGCEESAL